MVTVLLSPPGPVDLGPISPRLRFHYIVDPPGGFSSAFIFGLRPIKLVYPYKNSLKFQLFNIVNNVTQEFDGSANTLICIQDLFVFNSLVLN